MRIIISMPLSLLFLFSLSLLFLFTCSRGGTATAQNLIYETCKTCSRFDPNVNFGFCTSSLQAAPASRCAALVSLGKISIRLVHYNVTDTRCQVKQLLKKKKLDPFVKECLQDCLGLYNDAISSSKQAMKQYDSKNYADANTHLSSVMDAASTCEDGFMEKQGVVSPLTKGNNDTFHLSAMALSIVHLIGSGSRGS
ncbi:hypothetical protein RHMOL_Rhmol01G0205100 [Rhododendron molle]|uniref:Uncharacterized protein n=1 Tax=Rhododendron molle TaxID=49168 RepID=A0ACC0Q5G8_RHOML|nr:hypothetical protein RHMOL_Rhmol01G0205100 [Rhododendron molle]